MPVSTFRGPFRVAHVAGFALLLLSTAPLAAAGPSFSCAKAVAPVDRAICDDPDLSALDLSLETAFRDALKRDPAGKVALLDAQRRWLAQRARACSLPASGPASPDSRDCLKKQFQDRIATLGPAAPHAPDPLCTRVVERVKAGGGYTAKEDWKVLVAGLTTDPKSLVRFQFDGEEVTPKIQATLPKSDDDDGPTVGAPTLFRFGPKQSLLAVETIQGTLLCQSMNFYRRDAGKIKAVSAPGGADGDDYCWTSQIFVGDTTEPGATTGLFANEIYAIDHSELTLWAREGETWRNACRLRADYDTKFEIRDKFCATGTNCADLEPIALALADARKKISGDEPPAKLGEAQLTKPAHPPMEGDDELPTFGKTVVEGYTAFEASAPYYAIAGPKGLLLVRISHGTLGWRTDDDYLVAFFATAGDKATPIAGLMVHDRRTALRDVVVK